MHIAELIVLGSRRTTKVTVLTHGAFDVDRRLGITTVAVVVEQHLHLSCIMMDNSRKSVVSWTLVGDNVEGFGLVIAVVTGHCTRFQA